MTKITNDAINLYIVREQNIWTVPRDEYALKEKRPLISIMLENKEHIILDYSNGIVINGVTQTSYDMAVATLQSLILSSGGSGSGVSIQREVVINSDEAEIPGKQYQTYAHALAYIQTQTVDQNHPWVISFAGVLHEDITVYANIELAGIGTMSSWIDGDVDISSAGALFGAVIKNCVIGNLLITSGGSESVTLKDCTLLDCTTTTGTHTIMTTNCFIVKGDFSNIIVQGSSNNIISYYGDIILYNPKLIQCYMITQPTFTISIEKGNLQRCNLNLGTNFIIIDDIRFRFCVINNDYIIDNGISVNMQYCTYHDTFTVNGILNTKICDLDNTPIIGTGTWYNTGEAFDPRGTILSQSDVQSALVELSGKLGALGVGGTFTTVDGKTVTYNANGVITGII